MVAIKQKKYNNNKTFFFRNLKCSFSRLIIWWVEVVSIINLVRYMKLNKRRIGARRMRWCYKMYLGKVNGSIGSSSRKYSETFHNKHIL